MSSRKHYWASCQQKVKYKTEISVKEACARMQEKHPYAVLTVYSCRYCHHWHFGNSFTEQDALKSFKKLKHMMSQRNFFVKCPLDVQAKLLKKLHNVIGFLREETDHGNLL
jgi:hypothetical protein